MGQKNRRISYQSYARNRPTPDRLSKPGTGENYFTLQTPTKVEGQKET